MEHIKASVLLFLNYKFPYPTATLKRIHSTLAGGLRASECRDNGSPITRHHALLLN